MIARKPWKFRRKRKPGGGRKTKGDRVQIAVKIHRDCLAVIDAIGPTRPDAIDRIVRGSKEFFGEAGMSHTQGPWKIFSGWGSDKRRPVIVDSISDAGGKFVGNCICHMASTNPDVDANARLIAAAPELLEFAKEVVQLSADECNFYLLSLAQNAVNKVERKL